ncbi:hypothetical protein MTY59_48140 [Mycobacterium senriense]|uniref:Uncharacterized protein n=1 Tax=Mycobacterium senriense TaxID=2775496 RepID=A0ABN6IN85_9MYCO|nr:hypothetical protein MTY59_48140 [Mycobacterium senriense]
MKRSRPLEPQLVISHHAPGSEGQPNSWIVEAFSKCLQGSRKQIVITVYELNTFAAGKFYTFVVVSCRANARLIADKSVSRSQQ